MTQSQTDTTAASQAGNDGRSDRTAVSFDHVSKRFGGRTVVDSVSFTVEQGSTAVIIGPSGSGKSTVLRMINQLETPTSGTVRVLGQDLGDPATDIRELRSSIGMVFQHYSLFPQLNVVDNVAFPLRHAQGLDKAAARKAALEALEQVGIAKLANHYPDQISGGERQRAAIARALTTKPKIMLFDEVTSALDPEHVKSVLELIAGLKDQGITLVVVTHEMRFARQAADTVLYMDGGHLLETGSSDEIFNHPRSERLQAFLSAVE